jgi:hypothetical protein
VASCWRFVSGAVAIALRLGASFRGPHAADPPVVRRQSAGSQPEYPQCARVPTVDPQSTREVDPQSTRSPDVGVPLAAPNTCACRVTGAFKKRLSFGITNPQPTAHHLLHHP